MPLQTTEDGFLPSFWSDGDDDCQLWVESCSSSSTHVGEAPESLVSVVDVDDPLNEATYRLLPAQILYADGIMLHLNLQDRNLRYHEPWTKYPYTAKTHLNSVPILCGWAISSSRSDPFSQRLSSRFPCLVHSDVSQILSPGSMRKRRWEQRSLKKRDRQKPTIQMMNGSNATYERILPS